METTHVNVQQTGTANLDLTKSRQFDAFLAHFHLASLQYKIW